MHINAYFGTTDTVPIEETFFFHSFIGFDPKAELVSLPPEPVVRLIYM